MKLYIKRNWNTAANSAKKNTRSRNLCHIRHRQCRCIFSWSNRLQLLIKVSPSYKVLALRSKLCVLQMQHCTAKYLKVPGAVNITGNLGHWEHTVVSETTCKKSLLLGSSIQVNQMFKNVYKLLEDLGKRYEQTLGLRAWYWGSRRRSVELVAPINVNTSTETDQLFKLHFPFMNGVMNF